MMGYSTFIVKLIKPNINALVGFWAKDASIEMLETELMKMSVQLRGLWQEARKGMMSAVSLAVDQSTDCFRILQSSIRRSSQLRSCCSKHPPISLP
jgi:hypothetical protein